MSKNALVLTTQTYDSNIITRVIKDFNSWLTRYNIDTYSFKLVDQHAKFDLPSHDCLLLLEDDPFAPDLLLQISILDLTDKEVFLV